MIDFSNLKCPDCEFISISKKSFGMHIARTHNKTLKDFVLSVEHKGVLPKCKCGCNVDVSWHRTKNVFNEYTFGHGPGSFKFRQPVLSKDVLKKRNESIKRALAERRANINARTQSIVNVKKVVAAKEDVIDSVKDVIEQPLEVIQNVTLASDIEFANNILERVKTLINDSTFVLKDDSHAIITREELIRINEKDVFPNAAGREFTKEKLLPAVREFFREYVKRNGWFYPTTKDTLGSAITSIANYSYDEKSDEISSLTTLGSDYLKCQFKSYWDVDNGPVQSFLVDKKLDGVLRYRLGLNDSKPYSYKLSDGSSVSCKETFDINIKNVRRGFVVQSTAVSWFKPTAAFEVYKRLLWFVENPVVWDPSCGFGARMLGFYSAFPTGTYIGTDPATKTFADLTKLSNQLIKHSGGSFNPVLFNTGSEFANQNMIKPESVDLVFTSPPYFDKEKYFDEPTQCWKSNDTKELWVKNYLQPTFVNAYNALKKDSYLVINIDSVNAQCIIDVAMSCGFVHASSMKLKIGIDHFSKKSGNSKNNFEPILIFQK